MGQKKEKAMETEGRRRTCRSVVFIDYIRCLSFAIITQSIERCAGYTQHNGKIKRIPKISYLFCFLSLHTCEKGQVQGCTHNDTSTIFSINFKQNEEKRHFLSLVHFLLKLLVLSRSWERFERRKRRTKWWTVHLNVDLPLCAVFFRLEFETNSAEFAVANKFSINDSSISEEFPSP